LPDSMHSFVNHTMLLSSKGGRGSTVSKARMFLEKSLKPGSQRSVWRTPRYSDSVEQNDVGPTDGKLDVETNYDDSWLTPRTHASDEPLELSLDHLFQHKVVEVPFHK